jgi:MarR family transcriptional regulator, negative regulator of the multidrug operon emrRAB
MNPSSASRSRSANRAEGPSSTPAPHDFLASLGALALTARLKRLTDRLTYDARALYDELDLAIEPSWHLIFLLLEAREPLTITEITAALGVAHPSVVATTTKMSERGYLKQQTNPDDGRSKRLRLSAKGRARLAEAKPIWEASRLGLEALVAETGVDALSFVASLERALDARGYRERTLAARDSVETGAP